MCNFNIYDWSRAAVYPQNSYGVKELQRSIERVKKMQYTP